jgi:hypothetical protein
MVEKTERDQISEIFAGDPAVEIIWVLWPDALAARRNHEWSVQKIK